MSNFAANTVVPCTGPLKDALQLIVVASRRFIPEVGFTAHTARAGIEELRSENGIGKGVSPAVKALLASPQILSAFPRGVEIALVEDIVRLGNAKAKDLLQVSESLATTNSFKGLDELRKADAEQSTGRAAGAATNGPKSMEEVVYLGLHAKLAAMAPYIRRWPQAIQLESRPENMPHALVKLAEFCDEINYYGERAESRRGSTATAAATTSAVVPLNKGPHTAGLSWYWNRAKIVPLYSTAVLHMIADDSEKYKDTYSFLKWSVKQGFAQ